MEILTVGHGSQSIERFINLLRRNRVEVLVDTRSKPFSARHPQFSQRVLAALLDEAGIRYVFLGSELGGRPRDAALYDQEGKPDYDKIAATQAYRQGIALLEELAKSDEITAIMCSESDYKECHRYKLIARTLTLDGATVRHILKDGSLDNPVMALFTP